MDRQREQWKREMARLERLHKRFGERHPPCREDQRPMNDPMPRSTHYVYLTEGWGEGSRLLRIEPATGRVWWLKHINERWDQPELPQYRWEELTIEK